MAIERGQCQPEEVMGQPKLGVEPKYPLIMINCWLILPFEVAQQADARADRPRQRIQRLGGLELSTSLLEPSLWRQAIDGIPLVRGGVTGVDLERFLEVVLRPG